jgi:hypothetical protein
LTAGNLFLFEVSFFLKSGEFFDSICVFLLCPIVPNVVQENSTRMTRMRRITTDKKITLFVHKNGFQMIREQIRVDLPDPRYPRAIITDYSMIVFIFFSHVLPIGLCKFPDIHQYESCCGFRKCQQIG